VSVTYSRVCSTAEPESIVLSVEAHQQVKRKEGNLDVGGVIHLAKNEPFIFSVGFDSQRNKLYT
jgi:hypothetical protein